MSRDDYWIWKKLCWVLRSIPHQLCLCHEGFQRVLIKCASCQDTMECINKMINNDLLLRICCLFLSRECMCACSVTQLSPTLCSPVSCSLLGASVRGISQARTLEWVAISFSRVSSWPRDHTRPSCTGRQILYPWAAWEAPILRICLSLSCVGILSPSCSIL